MKNTRESIYAKMRSHERFNVNIRARYALHEQGAGMQDCRITNLSASGAAVRFPLHENLRKDLPIIIEICIPNTIMHVSAQAEIVWRKQWFTEQACGIRFKSILSESMLRRLTQSP